MYAGVPTIAPGCVSCVSSAGGAGQAEVEDLDAARSRRLQPDVGRLDVAVDQAALVGRRQALGRSPGRCAAPPASGSLPLALEAVVERLAFEELHGQEGDAAVLADLVDGDDVVVLDRRPRPGPRGGSAAWPARWRPGPAAWP